MTSLQILTNVQSLLLKILNSYASQRSFYINELQDKIWDEKYTTDDVMQQTLNDLAYDLNFYEPYAPDRDEKLGYYDDDRLNSIVGAALASVGVFLEKN